MPRLVSLRRPLAGLALIVLAALPLRANAQATPANVGANGLTPEQQQALQDQIAQMQAIRDQVLLNMQNAGVDPQAFNQDIQQQMQNGTLDMNGLVQQLVQKGFMTQQMSDQLTGSLTQVQNTARTAALNTIRVRLNASDEEWGVLLPRIQRILELLPDVSPVNSLTAARNNAGALGGLGGLGINGNTPTTPTAKAFRALQDVLAEQNPSDEKIATRLAAWRELHKKTAEQLANAQADLLRVLTLRQEALLMGLGLI